MINPAQINAVVEVNGVRIKMLADGESKKIRLTVKELKTDYAVHEEFYSLLDPADIAAAFAKFSMSVTWAVTREVTDKKQANS